MLIVGLGNPGTEYDGTRHNIGFAVLDAMAKKFHLEFSFNKSLNADVAEGEGMKLVKPHTFMNKSGSTVSKLLRNSTVTPKETLIVFDDADMDFGKVRFRDEGRSGGHNGMKSIISVVDGGKDMPRVKIGIGRVEGERLDPDWVLGKWDPAQREVLPEVIENAIETILKWKAGELPAAQ